MNPLDFGRYAPAPPRVTLESLNERVENIEQILLSIQARQTPKWLSTGSWVTIAGSILGIAVKVLLEK